MRALASLAMLILVSGCGCGKRSAAPEPTAQRGPAADAAEAPWLTAADPAPPSTSQEAAEREQALAFLAALDAACENGTAAPTLPLMPSRFRALIPRDSLVEGGFDVICVREKLGLPEDEPAGLEEAMLLALNPFPADWIDRLERMCRDPAFHYDHLSALRFPKNQYFLMETSREDGARALAAARCLARRIAGDTPPNELSPDADGLMYRLDNLYRGIVARHGLK